ncbi:CAP domain-containing protein, partial [Chloroflexota bacterium]
ELVWDDNLYEYSLAHSKDMARENRLFHTNMNLPYAENAWGGQGSQSWGAETIVESWMNSDMHRTWLLCPHLKHVAVGAAYSSNGMYAS